MVQYDLVTHRINAHGRSNFDLELAEDPKAFFCKPFKYDSGSSGTMLHKFMLHCIHHVGVRS